MHNGRLLVVGFLIFGAAQNLGWSGPQVFFTSQESVERELIRLIDGTRESLDGALFQFSSKPLAAALGRAAERGVRIRLILDESKLPQAPAGEIRRLKGKRGKGRGVMHHKFALLDGQRVVTGSFNWTVGAEYANYENALILDDPETAAAYGREFETLWQRAQAGVYVSNVRPNEKRSARFRSRTARRARVHLKASRVKKKRSKRKARRVGLLVIR